MFLLDDIFKAIGARKQAKEQARAAKETEARQRAYQGASEARRGVSLGAMNRILSGFRGASGGYGSPTYTPASVPSYGLSSEELAGLSKPLPFAGASPVDVSKGAGWNMLGDIAGGAGNALLTAYTGGAFGKRGAGTLQSQGGLPAAEFAPTDIATSIDWSKRLGS